MLDTNTASYYLRGVAPVVRRVQARAPSELALSAVTVMELRYGAARRNAPSLTRAVEAFIAAIAVLPFDEGAADRAGTLRATMESKGIALGFADSQIAGHALTTSLALVSSDRAFRRVEGLTVRDWTRP